MAPFFVEKENIFGCPLHIFRSGTRKRDQ